MPIIKVGGEQVVLKPAATVVEPTVKKRTKYHVIRKDKTSEDYDKLKLVVDGEEKEISNSSKFMLDMLIKDSE